MSQDFSVIIYRGIISPRNCRELVYDLNTIDKGFLLQLMSTFQLPVAKGYGTHMVMHTGTSAYDVILAR